MRRLLLTCILSLFAWSLPAQALTVQGAVIHIQDGATLHADGDVTLRDGAGQAAILENYGVLELDGNWRNETSDFVFIPYAPGKVSFTGERPFVEIGGTNKTRFNHLYFRLKEQGEVRLGAYCENDGTLDLGNDVLFTGEHRFLMYHPAPEALQREGGTGPEVLHSTQSGYVRTDPGQHGGLARILSPDHNGEAYFFPVGSPLRFRPVSITADLDTFNVYQVGFVDHTPMDRLALGEGLGSLNPLYHHLLDRAYDRPGRESIRIYHDFQEDDICDVGQVALAIHDGQVWQDLGPTVGGHSAPHMSFTELLAFPDNPTAPLDASQIALAGRFIAPNLLSCVFPAEFLELGIRHEEERFALEWETNSELNIRGFEVFRSTDGANFDAYGWVDAVGTSNSPSYYQFEDAAVNLYQRYFYRVRQVDQNGFEKYSNTVEAILLGEEGYVVGNIYPNPVPGSAHLWLSVQSPQPLEMECFNSLGQLVWSQSYSLQAGYQELPVDLSELSAGPYLMRVRLGRETIHRRIVKD